MSRRTRVSAALPQQHVARRPHESTSAGFHSQSTLPDSLRCKLEHTTDVNRYALRGTCTKQGTTTLAQFNTELNATHQVAAWHFVPSAFTIKVGQSITAMNNGGEKHTFTEVKAFGGGIVPALNSASGNTLEAPECAALSANDMVAAGASFRTDAAMDVGTELYQCCIHPWMRATVTVTR